MTHLVVNDDNVKTHFKDIISVFVLVTFDEIMVVKEFLISLKEDVSLDQDNLKTLLGEIRQWLELNKFLFNRDF